MSHEAVNLTLSPSAQVGTGVTFGANVVVHDNVVIGDGVIVQDGAILGRYDARFEGTDADVEGAPGDPVGDRGQHGRREAVDLQMRRQWPFEPHPCPASLRIGHASPSNLNPGCI